MDDQERFALHDESVHSSSLRREVGTNFGSSEQLASAKLDEMRPADLSVPFDPSEAGGCVIPGYRFIELVGQGGTSVIYKAKQLLLDKVVAVKVLHPDLVVNELSIRRFEQEARSISKLSHPNIVDIHDFGVLKNGQPYIIMDFIEGQSLAGLIGSGGTLQAEKALKFFRQICDALSHAHSKGVVHRDLKPSNIMISVGETANESVKLLDFGIAKIVSQEDPAGQRLTKTGELFGSPAYMSPEQCMGQRVDARSDIYSFGCVMYEALSGSPPIQGDSLMQTIGKQISDKPRPLKAVARKLSGVGYWNAIVLRALEKEPDQRYQSIEELSGDLEALSAGKPPLSRRPPRLFRFSSSAQRWASFVAVLGALTGAIVYGAWQLNPAQTSDRVAQPPSTRAIADRAMQNPEKSVAKLTGPSPRQLQGDELAKYIAANTPLVETVPSFRNQHLTNKGLLSLCRLSNLTKLDINGSMVNDDGMSALKSLKNLKQLDVSYMRISDKGLAAVRNLPLESLIVTGTDIEDGSASTLATLTHLTTLTMNDTKTGARLLGGLENLKLQRLWISGTQNGDDSIAALTKLPSLQSLGAAHLPGLSDDGLRRLESMPQLERLDLSYDKISPKGFQYIAALSKLQMLEVAYTEIRGKDLLAISKMPALRQLSLAGTEIGDADLVTLRSSNSLENLNIVGSRVTARGVLGLKNVHSLKILRAHRSQVPTMYKELPFKVQLIYDLNVPEQQR